MNNTSLFKNYIVIILAILLPIIVLIVFLINDKPTVDSKSEVLGSSIKTVNAKEFSESMSANSIIIDVRTPQEYDEGYLNNAINIDFNNTNFREEISKLDKDKEYLIYCRSGNRSGQALNIMKSMGFKSVTNLSGGILSWISGGFSTICNNC